MSYDSDIHLITEWRATIDVVFAHACVTSLRLIATEERERENSGKSALTFHDQ